MTLRWRLSLAFLLVVILPLAVAAVVVGRGVPHALDAAAENRLAASRAGAAALAQETCVTARLTAELLGREAVASTSTAAVDDIVRRGLATYAVVTDPSGGVVARAGTLASGGRPTPAALGSCSRGTRASVAAAAIADSVAVRSANGHGLGEAAVAISLGETTARRLAAASNAQVTLLNGHEVIASTLPRDAAVELAKAGADVLTSGESREIGGRLVSAALLGHGPVTVVVSVDRPGVQGLEALVVAVLVAALVLATLIGWLLARVTTRPLSELSAAAARVADGNLDTRIAVRSRDEVGRLAAAFNEMTDELRLHIGELHTSRDELRRNLARLGDTLSSTHDLGRILSVILDTALDTTHASAGVILVAEADRDELRLRAGRGLEGRGVDGDVRVRIGEGVTGTVAATGDAVRGHVGVDGLDLSPAEPKAVELISVPLRVSGGIFGVLNLYDRADGKPFDDGDLETIRSFASQAAVALDNVLLHQEAQRLSVTDELTGLANYRFFQATLGREIERAARFHRPLALLMLDLDRFKQVNDAHGHQVGDAVLVEVADRVRGEIREVDVLARYGGEEFVFVLPETGREGAGYTAARICTCIRRQPVRVGELELPLTVSVGVAVFPAHGDDPVTLLRAADEALYAAKSAGRNQWRMAKDSQPANAR